jgi:hypothetical protein
MKTGVVNLPSEFARHQQTPLPTIHNAFISFSPKVYDFPGESNRMPSLAARH